MTARFPIKFALLALVAPFGVASAIGAAPQEGARQERVESESAAGTSGYRRLVTREETGDRTLETWVVEASSPNGGYESLLEVEEETVRIDPETTRASRREYTMDPDGRRSLLRTVEEERIERPDGGASVVRDISETDANGRPRLTRQETETTTSSGDGAFRTEILAATPGINRSGLVPTERILETGTRDADDRLLDSDRTTYSDPAGRGNWEALERRITAHEYNAGEVGTVESVYRRNAGGELVLDEQVVSREWTDAGGSDRSTQDVYSTNIPGQRSPREPRLLRQVEVVRTPTPDGGWEMTREVRESRQGRFQVVERETERGRPNRDGGTDIEREVQRLDANGRLRTVRTGTSSESGS